MMEQAVVDVTRPPGDVTITEEKHPYDLWPLECASECCRPTQEMPELHGDRVRNISRPPFSLLEHPTG